MADAMSAEYYDQPEVVDGRVLLRCNQYSGLDLAMWGARGALMVLTDYRHADVAIVDDPAVVDWFHSLDAGKPECCGHPMTPWGPRDPGLFTCLHCHKDWTVAP